ncbi:MAG: phosphomevalonate kinase [Planctomycetota bacterium]|nr:MAG: phosphomevalonate kinase [Planctomycetota bacterium]
MGGRALELRVPLKLVLAGEYGVLEPRGLGVVAGLERLVRAMVLPRPEGGVRVEDLTGSAGRLVLSGPEADGQLWLAGAPCGEGEPPHPVRQALALWHGGAGTAGQSGALGRWRVVGAALELAYRYVAALGLRPQGLELQLDSSAGSQELASGERTKLGLGTSAAVTVASAAAVLAAHGVPIDRPTFRRAVLRLSLLAHHAAQGGAGSGIDVAAASYGGVLAFIRPSEEWLAHAVRHARTPLELVRAPWPELEIEPLPVPGGMRLLAGFTGRASGTPELVRGYRRWRHEQPGAHARFRKLSHAAAAMLVAALRRGVPAEVQQAIRHAHRALVFLTEQSGLGIVTPALERLVALVEQHAGSGAAAKVSGAGGGDCGLAIVWDEQTEARVMAGWSAEGILPIPLEIARWGVRERALDGPRARGSA